MLAKKRSKFWLKLLLSFLILTTTIVVEGKDCRDIIKNLRFDFCSEQTRRKRDAEFLEILNPANDFASMTEDKRIRKRQIMSMRELLLSSRVPMYDTPYPAVPGYRYENAPVVPPSYSDVYRSSQVYGAYSQNHGYNTDYGMSDDELFEIFDEIYERLPRSSAKPKNEMFQNFKKDYDTTYRLCCKDPGMCPKGIASCLY